MLYFPAFPSESVRDWKFKRVYHFRQGTCNRLKTILYWNSLYPTELAKESEMINVEPWVSRAPFSVIILHGLGKITITREAPGVLLLITHNFHHTNLGALRTSLWQRLPDSSESPLLAKDLKGMVFPLPWQNSVPFTLTDPVFQLQSIPVLRKYSC